MKTASLVLRIIALVLIVTAFLILLLPNISVNYEVEIWGVKNGDRIDVDSEYDYDYGYNYFDMTERLKNEGFDNFFRDCFVLFFLIAIAVLVVAFFAKPFRSFYFAAASLLLMIAAIIVVDGLDTRFVIDYEYLGNLYGYTIHSEETARFYFDYTFGIITIATAFILQLLGGIFHTVHTKRMKKAAAAPAPQNQQWAPQNQQQWAPQNQQWAPQDQQQWAPQDQQQWAPQDQQQWTPQDQQNTTAGFVDIDWRKYVPLEAGVTYDPNKNYQFHRAEGFVGSLPQTFVNRTFPKCPICCHPDPFWTIGQHNQMSWKGNLYMFKCSRCEGIISMSMPDVTTLGNGGGGVALNPSVGLANLIAKGSSGKEAGAVYAVIESVGNSGVTRECEGKEFKLEQVQEMFLRM